MNKILLFFNLFVICFFSIFASEVLDENPGFEAFAKANHLNAHQSFHGHEVKSDSQGKIQLLYSGTWVAWETVSQLVKFNKQGKMVDHAYTEDGIVMGGRETHIHLLKRLKNYDGQARVEVVNRTGMCPHVWIRLINQIGEVYTAGMFGPNPINSFWKFVKAFNPRSGRVLSPDPFEIYDAENTKLVTTFPISDEQFEKALELCKQFQLDRELSFQILNMGSSYNCAGFVSAVMKELGIPIRTHSWKRPIANPYDIKNWQYEIEKERREERSAA